MSQLTNLKRDSAIELLRLFLMFMIIIHHSIVHGMGLRGLVLDSALPMHFSTYEKPVATIVNCLCICAVNCFVLISGYFSIKTTLKKSFRFLGYVLFYTFFFNSLYYLLCGDVKHSVRCLFFLSHPSYWFVNSYLYLMIFTPVLNVAFDRVSKKHLNLFLSGLLLISCYLGFIWQNPLNPDGYNLFQLILMYCIGRYIYSNNISLSRIKSIAIYFSCSLMVGIAMYVLWKAGHNTLSWRMTYYNNPLIILASIGIFFFFKSFSFNSSFINKAASSAFAIYLIQSSESCEILYYKWINSYHYIIGGGIWPLIIISALVIIIASLLVDQIQKTVTNNIVSFISKLNGLRITRN